MTTPPLRRFARFAVYHGLRLSGTLQAKRLLRGRRGAGWATVLVFHGVTPDRPEDGLNISPQRFRSILGMLRREYRVLAYGELIERLRRGTPFTGRETAITFDDGYLNNYEHAAPLLREFELPACFFLTAGYVGTAGDFWWDAEHGRHSGLMSWAQARELADAGFEIGCHSWSHADLGREPLGSAARELGEARQRIQDETGSAVEHFAYPYGGRDNIRPEWIDAVRAAGFISNAAAYNGHVTVRDDPFLVPRLGAAPQRSLTELRIDIDDAW
jgi:peptidoglycan/xylan/chitin deacetylase (PgdA/CDA1 family)